MFCFRKKEYLTKDDLQSFQENLLQKLTEQGQQSNMETEGRILELLEASKKVEKRQNKIENSLEDLLEQSDEQRELLTGIGLTSKQALAEAGKKTTQLLEVIMKYEEALHQYRELTKDQYEGDRILMDRLLEKACTEAGVQKIWTKGLKADTTMVEIMDTEPTEDSLKDGIISQEVSAGWIYEGRVFRKAKVVIYKYTDPEKQEHPETKSNIFSFSTKQIEKDGE